MATSRKPPKDPSERKPDGLAGETETIERAISSGQPKVRYSELYQAVTVPPGPTTTLNSRAAGANLPELEVSGARGVPTGKKGSQFKTVRLDDVVTANVATDQAWSTPPPDDSGIEYSMPDVVGHVTDAVVGFHSGQPAPSVSVVEDL